MARQRVALTDKEEKILVQAQLMGLSTESMVKIGNRLKALEHDREMRQNVEAVTSRYTYSAIPAGWCIKNAEGYEFNFTNRHVKYSRDWSRSKDIYYDVGITKPGTRFHAKSDKNQKIYIDPNYPARMCPENSKELHALMRAIARGSFHGIT